MDVYTVLHEFGHYIDGMGTKFTGRPVKSIVPTRDFYDISYDMSQEQQGCAPPRSADPQDWVSRYGFLGAHQCPQGLSPYGEEWPEAFSMYVAAGNAFRAAAQQNATIRAKYDWIKANVFRGREYDTNLAAPVHFGCNDVPGTQGSLPGYAKCDDDYVWDGELRLK